MPDLYSKHLYGTLMLKQLLPTCTSNCERGLCQLFNALPWYYFCYPGSALICSIPTSKLLILCIVLVEGLLQISEMTEYLNTSNENKYMVTAWHACPHFWMWFWQIKSRPQNTSRNEDKHIRLSACFIFIWSIQIKVFMLRQRKATSCIFLHQASSTIGSQKQTGNCWSNSALVSHCLMIVVHSYTLSP